MTEMHWQIAAFCGPLVLTLLVYWGNKMSGYKTTSMASLVTVVGAAETMDLSFLPPNVLAPLIAGMGLSTALANTVLTRRGDDV